MKSELFYGRLDPERLTVEELKTLVWEVLHELLEPPPHLLRQRRPPACRESPEIFCHSGGHRLAIPFVFFVSTDIDKIKEWLQSSL